MYGLPTRTFALTLLAAGAFLAGCSETPSPTGPGSERPAFALGDDEGAVAEFGKLKVCKTASSNVPGVFTVSRVAVGASTGTVLANVTIDPGDCAVVALDGGGNEVGSNVTVTETSAGLVPPVTGTRIDANPTTTSPVTFANGGTVFLNSFHGFALIFHNEEEVPEGCTYTKGWYQNKNGSPTVIAVDGRTIAQAQAIFNATPGKPGTVTWQGGNNTLNLYQQLLAALNNLGGDANWDAGPDAVDDAIWAALQGTGGMGTNITTTLTKEEVGALTEVLSSFNEGLYTGWPHCDSVVDPT